jgi:hypothetical protein
LDGVDVGWQVVTSLGELLVNSEAAPLPLSTAAGLAVIVAIAILLTRAVRSWRRQRGSGLWMASTSPLTPLVTATVAYWSFLVASQLTTAINPIGHRLLYPMLPAMTVLGVLGVRALIIGSRRRIVRRLWRIRVAGFAAYLTVLACAGIGWALHAADQGLGYNQVRLRDEAWIPVVRRLPSDASLISDNPYVVHWLTDHEPVHPSFDLAFYAGSDTTERARSLCSLVQRDTDTYLLWLGTDANEGVEDFAELGFSTTPVRIGASYALYDVTDCLRI